jgi:microcompartment protein CcmK/EutM
MRLGKVIGRVTLSEVVPELRGARWLVVSPLSRNQLSSGGMEILPPSSEPSLVVYDDLGAGRGDTIGFVEGREAAQPLNPIAAIDAINAAIVDTLFHHPQS